MFAPSDSDLIRPFDGFHATLRDKSLVHDGMIITTQAGQPRGLLRRPLDTEGVVAGQGGYRGWHHSRRTPAKGPSPCLWGRYLRAPGLVRIGERTSAIR